MITAIKFEHVKIGIHSLSTYFLNISYYLSKLRLLYRVIIFIIRIIYVLWNRLYHPIPQMIIFQGI